VNRNHIWSGAVTHQEFSVYYVMKKRIFDFSKFFCYNQARKEFICYNEYINE